MEENILGRRRKDKIYSFLAILVVFGVGYFLITKISRKVNTYFATPLPSVKEVTRYESYLDDYVSFSYPDSWAPYLEGSEKLASSSAKVVHAINLGNPKLGGIQDIVFKEGTLDSNKPSYASTEDKILISGVNGYKWTTILGNAVSYMYATEDQGKTFVVLVNGPGSYQELEAELDTLVKSISIRK